MTTCWRLHNIARPRARNNCITVSTTKICFFIFLRVETRNSQFTEKHYSLSHFFSLQFMLKSQQKVDIRLSKIYQSHRKLCEWRKVDSRFTEIVYGSSLSEDSRKCQRRFKLVVYHFDSHKQETTSNWILMTQMLTPGYRAFECRLCWHCWCSGDYAVKHKLVFLSGWTVR